MNPITIYAIPYFLIIGFSVIAGVCTLVAGAWLRSTYKRGWLVMISGVLRVIFVFNSGIFGLMLIVAGAIEIAAAIRLRKHVTGTGFLAMAGIASILFPLMIIGAGSFKSAVALLGGLLIVFGACSLAFGLTMRASTP